MTKRIKKSVYNAVIGIVNEHNSKVCSCNEGEYITKAELVEFFNTTLGQPLNELETSGLHIIPSGDNITSKMTAAVKNKLSLRIGDEYDRWYDSSEGPTKELGTDTDIDTTETNRFNRLMKLKNRIDPEDFIDKEQADTERAAKEALKGIDLDALGI